MSRETSRLVLSTTSSYAPSVFKAWSLASSDVRYGRWYDESCWHCCGHGVLLVEPLLGREHLDRDQLAAGIVREHAALARRGDAVHVAVDLRRVLERSRERLGLDHVEERERAAARGRRALAREQQRDVAEVAAVADERERRALAVVPLGDDLDLARVDEEQLLARRVLLEEHLAREAHARLELEREDRREVVRRVAEQRHTVEEVPRATIGNSYSSVLRDQILMGHVITN